MNISQVRLVFTVFLLGLLYMAVHAQSTANFVDSVRNAYHVPEVAYAVVTVDAIPEMGGVGTRRADRDQPARPDDQFHIGSNTKAITCFLAALLVQQNKLRWDTRFFDLFPELKSRSRSVYHPITLQDLLTFRGKLPSYTYTFAAPIREQITGDEAQQRYHLAEYFVAQKPMHEQNGITPSNVDYVLAGLMLEKASGKSYQTLVADFGTSEGIDFGFGYPNVLDSSQTWGHDAAGIPQAPADHYKLNWLLCAGNVHADIYQYSKFVQLLLEGLAGKSNLLPQTEFEKLLFGLPTFSFGWFNYVDPVTGHTVATNTGNVGAFITRVDIVKETRTGFVVFTNAYTPETTLCINTVMEYLKQKQYP